ncbi:MAG: DNA polymerase III subunit delta' [Chloroflexota bacterium]
MLVKHFSVVASIHTLGYNGHMSWDICGHDWAVELLCGHINQQRVRHAYLFTGPPGVGRRTLALRFSQALNCPETQAAGDPCRTCRTCTQLEHMQHPDLSVVQAEQVSGILRVEQVRDLQRSLALSPYQAYYRIALLLRFEEANPSASNALLKTLEEPPPKVVLLLTSENPDSLLPTITSRCEVLRLRPLSLDKTEQCLQAKWGLPPEKAHLLAHLSGGRMGYALKLHQHPEQLEQRQTWLDELYSLLGASRVQRFAYVERLAKNKTGLRQALLVWLTYWRDVLLLASHANAPLTNIEREAEIKELASLLDTITIKRIVSQLKQTIILIEKNINPRLAVEVVMLDLPRLTD